MWWYKGIQWNPSNVDIMVPPLSAHNIEVTIF